MMKPRVVDIGCGRMGRLTMKYAGQSGLLLIGAFDRNSKRIGVRVGEVIGEGDSTLAIQHPSELPEFLARHRPDCVIFATRSLLKEIESELKLCASLGISAVTT